jgi:DNA-binding CsgD family transcriptional regulator/PAS domain-containing protein
VANHRIPRSTFCCRYDRCRAGGVDGLADRAPALGAQHKSIRWIVHRREVFAIHAESLPTGAGESMSLDERVLAVIGSIYEAALDDTLWPAALNHLVALTGSQAATFWTLESSQTPRLPVFVAHNFAPDFVQEYLDGLVPHDPTVRYLAAHPDEPIVHDSLVIAERDKLRHPYYDWHARRSDTWFRMVAQTCPVPSAQAGIALHRSRRAGSYEPSDVARFTYIYGHLKRALAIGFQVERLNSIYRSAAALLDCSPVGILVLDVRRRLVYCNRTLEEIGADGDGIRITQTGVVLMRNRENEQLKELIASALSPLASARGRGGVMRVRRPTGKRPYAILVSPLAGASLSALSPRRSVCIVVTDPEKSRPLPVDRLREAFSLTAAEAGLAALIAAGQDLRSAADRLGITYGTARVRLARIFEKTETRRQGELVKVLLTTLAPI